MVTVWAKLKFKLHFQYRLTETLVTATWIFLELYCCKIDTYRVSASCVVFKIRYNLKLAHPVASGAHALAAASRLQRPPYCTRIAPVQ